MLHQIYLKSSDTFNLQSYWCQAKNPNVSRNSGFMFGGLYSASQVNPFTGSQSCPGRFNRYNFGADVVICLSREFDLDSQYSVRLAYFFSCQTPKGQDQCPPGYSPHLATIINNCEIYYCSRPERINRQKILRADRPPYGEFLFRDIQNGTCTAEV